MTNSLVKTTARVIAESRGSYRVRADDGAEYMAKVTGRRMFGALSREDFPAVGDWVTISEAGGDYVVIHDILPRKSVLKRRHGDRGRDGEKNDVQIIAANIDVAFIVQAVGGRDYSLNRFERYFAMTRDGGVEPVIILNKADTITENELKCRVDELRQRFSGVNLITTSTINSQGVDELRKLITVGRTYCFLGSSGVGKSSLINKLLGEDTLRTAQISGYSDRGKHVTTRRQMYFLANGGVVIDNPGIREVGMADARQGVSGTFDDIEALAENCRFADCMHIGEPDCAVIAAIRSGELDEERYKNYIALRKESAYLGMNDMERRQKDRGFGKFIDKVKKDLRRLGHKDY